MTTEQPEGHDDRAQGLPLAHVADVIEVTDRSESPRTLEDTAAGAVRALPVVTPLESGGAQWKHQLKAGAADRR